MKSTRKSLDLSRKSLDIGETSKALETIKRENQENTKPAEDEDRQSKKADYNQRLLKSLERKTLRESVSAIS